MSADGVVDKAASAGAQTPPPAAEAVVETAAAAAKDGPKFWSFKDQFTRSEKWLDKKRAAATAAGDEKMLAKIAEWELKPGSIRIVKSLGVGAGVAAGVYGLYSVLAGTGNQGPGERAESVSKNREAEPAAGRA